LEKCADPSQYNYFIVTGTILCTLYLISLLTDFQATSLLSSILPILYIIGGIKNKKSFKIPK